MNESAIGNIGGTNCWNKSTIGVLDRTGIFLIFLWEIPVNFALEAAGDWVFVFVAGVAARLTLPEADLAAACAERIAGLATTDWACAWNVSKFMCEQ